VSNIAVLMACLILGVVLRASVRLPENAPATINGFITNVALPALILVYVHDAQPKVELIGAVLMPWLLFACGAAVFWALARTFHFSRGTTGALMMLGGLGNTSFVGLPMIECFYGASYLSIGILIDQLGTYLVLSTLGITTACLYSESRASCRDVAVRISTFPPLLAVLAALALAPLPFPEWVVATLHRLGGTLAPLALISVGAAETRSICGQQDRARRGAWLQAVARTCLADAGLSRHDARRNPGHARCCFRSSHGAADRRLHRGHPAQVEPAIGNAHGGDWNAVVLCHAATLVAVSRVDLSLSGVTPIEHDQAQMWQLSADRISVRMQFGLPVQGTPEPLMVKIDFDAGVVDQMIERLLCCAPRCCPPHLGRRSAIESVMMQCQARVRWMATPESWDDIVVLYTGLETVAFWQANGTLDVETRQGRVPAPIGEVLPADAV